MNMARSMKRRWLGMREVLHFFFSHIDYLHSYPLHSMQMGGSYFTCTDHQIIRCNSTKEEQNVFLCSCSVQLCLVLYFGITQFSFASRMNICMIWTIFWKMLTPGDLNVHLSSVVKVMKASKKIGPSVDIVSYPVRSLISGDGGLLVNCKIFKRIQRGMEMSWMNA